MKLSHEFKVRSFPALIFVDIDIKGLGEIELNHAFIECSQSSDSIR